MSDDPGLQAAAAVPAVVAAAAPPASTATFDAARGNAYFHHLTEVFSNDVFATIQFLADEAGELFCRIIHGETAHDHPTFVSSVAATPTAFPEFLCRPTTASPTQCSAIVLNTNARCRLSKTDNGETCRIHAAQSLGPTLGNYDERPSADKCLSCFKKYRSTVTSTSVLRCLTCPRFAHTRTATHAGCVKDMPEAAEDSTIFGICSFCHRYRSPQLVLMPVPDYFGDTPLPFLQPREQIAGVTMDDGMLGARVEDATPLRRRPTSTPSAFRASEEAAHTAPAALGGSAADGVLMLTPPAPDRPRAALDQEFDDPALGSVQEPLNLNRQQRGGEVRESLATRLQQVQQDEPGLELLRAELEASALREAAATLAAAEARGVVNPSRPPPSTEPVVPPAAAVSMPIVVATNPATAAPDSRLDQMLSLLTKLTNDQGKKIEALSHQVQLQAEVSSSAPRDTSGSDNGKATTIAKQYPSDDGYGSDHPLFNENYAMNCSGHEERNRVISRGARKIQDIGREEEAALVKASRASSMLTLDGTRILIESKHKEADTKLGTYAQYSHWHEYLHRHIASRPDHYVNKERRLRTLEYIKHHFQAIMLRQNADFSFALAFLLSAQNFFATYKFDINDCELDRVVMRGGILALERTQIYPAILVRALQISPGIAVSLAEPAATGGGLGGTGPADTTGIEKPAWSAVYCYYCASKDHDMMGHPKNMPIVKNCRDCKHAHAKIGPLRTDCAVKGCGCKCLSEADNAVRMKKF
mmetsp:Transcript_35206/g.86369  ORF Transcript_35206/g.86369 Transcript_35206/m.86369 type:complete len:758 (-) Transcript_35206:5403-7676(-)